jgi:broad specificity phosphatase PhoE
MGLDPDDYATDDRLIEITFGEWERKRLEELGRGAGGNGAAQRQQVGARTARRRKLCRGGERVAAFLDDLESPSVIVCHGGILRATQFIMEDGDGPAIADTSVPQDKVYVFDGKRTFWTE